MVGKILGGIVAIIVIIFALGFVLPDKVHVEREAVIDAPQEEVFALISDFKSWNSWSPWAAKDPDTKYTYSGSGVGHKMVWESDDPNVGNGSQVITAFEAPSLVVTHLEFDGMGGADASFTLSPVEGGGTKVVWAFHTAMRDGFPVYMKPMGAYMGFFMDGWVGKDYEQGLANLKRVAEAG